MRPQLHSVWFGGQLFERMARVLRHTAEEHCRDWDVHVRHVNMKRFVKSDYAWLTHLTNTQKMYEWNRIVQQAEDNARLLLLDTDTFILRPLDDVWATPFDLAYTSKPSHHRFPFNSGVVFVRVSPRLRRFFRAWWKLNRHLLRTPVEHRYWRDQYGGINQAALGAMLDRNTHGLSIVELPCREWNCEDATWPRFDRDTRIVHVKGTLRRAIFIGHQHATMDTRPLAELWADLERGAAPALTRPQDTMDIVIPVRPGEDNEELRYAIRSFEENLPHHRIVIAGHKPAWLHNVLHIPTQQLRSKYRNSTGNLEAACRHPDVSTDFILANDDFFVMQPVHQLPALHRGLVEDVERYYESRSQGSRYLRGLRATRDLLVRLGCTIPFSYEVHAPMPMNKRKFLEVLALGRTIPVLHKRTLYGNLAELGGIRVRDPKVITTGTFSHDVTFLSTMDSSWHGQVGEYIKARFVIPSKYERPTPRPSYRRTTITPEAFRRQYGGRQRARVGW